MLPAPARSGRARAACATSPCLRGCRAPRRPAGRSGRRSRRARSRRAAPTAGGSTSARTCSAVTIAIASSPTSGIGIVVAASRAGAPAARFLAAHDVDRAPVRERSEERAQAAASGLERLGPLPQREEHLLGDVLGGVPVADDPRRQPEDVGAELVVEVGQRARVTRDEAVPDRQLPRTARRVVHHRDSDCFVAGLIARAGSLRISGRRRLVCPSDRLRPGRMRVGPVQHRGQGGARDRREPGHRADDRPGLRRGRRQGLHLVPQEGRVRRGRRRALEDRHVREPPRQPRRPRRPATTSRPRSPRSETRAAHPRQQRGRHLGRAARRVPGRRVGQGARPQREGAVLPDPRAAARSSKPRRPPTTRRA